MLENGLIIFMFLLLQFCMIAGSIENVIRTQIMQNSGREEFENLL